MIIICTDFLNSNTSTHLKKLPDNQRAGFALNARQCSPVGDDGLLAASFQVADQPQILGAIEPLAKWIPSAKYCFARPR